MEVQERRMWTAKDDHWAINFIQGNSLCDLYFGAEKFKVTRDELEELRYILNHCREKGWI